MRVCRFNFNREYAVNMYRPRKVRGTICKRRNCPYKGKTVREVIEETPSGALQKKLDVECPEASHLMHGKYCPSVLAMSEVKRRLRKGKELVLPVLVHHDHEGPGTPRFALDYRPRINREDRFGRLGRIMVLRYNPMVGSSNPVAQVLLRCNLDVQCTDRVYVLLDELERSSMPAAAADSKVLLRSQEEQAVPGFVGEEEVMGKISLESGPVESVIDEPVGHVGLLGSGIFDEDGDDLMAYVEEADDPAELYQDIGECSDAMWLGPEDPDVEEIVGEGCQAKGEEEVEDVSEWEVEDGDDEPPPADDAASLRRAFVLAIERLFRDAHDQAMYIKDYSTKSNPIVGDILGEQAVGVERFQLERRARKAKRKGTGHDEGDESVDEELLEVGRRLLVRLETSSNRATLKKLPEMMFQMLYGHECYMSHSTWTVFCKKLVWLGFKAQRRQQLLFTGEDPECEDELFEPEFPAHDEEGMQESDVEEGATMHAVPLYGSGETDGHVAADLLQGEAVEQVREEAPADADIVWPRVGFEVTVERNQCIDWLHRGYREPLASMGIYVYCMYVYTAHADPGTYDPQDFHVYRFAATHPGAGQRVQKLRVNEMFKVPRLFGFTMPRQDSEPEKNALFKSVLFKPVFAEVHDQVEAFRTLVDERGYFQGPWEQWFKLQRIMADRFYKLQDAAGKLFTLADIDVDALQMQDPCSHGRVRPSAAEFVAKIVVEVVTNMDMDAEAKSRPRQPTRPDAKDYDRDEVNDVDVGLRRDAEGAVLEPGLPSGPGPAVEPDDLQKEELLKRTQAPHPVPDGDLFEGCVCCGVWCHQCHV